MASGYSIPVSISDSQSLAASQNTFAPVIFNFGAGNVSGGVADFENDQTTASEAKSSAAVDGNATTSGAGMNVGGMAIPTWAILLAVAGVGYYLYKH